jgi:hypothetical protein
MIATSLGQPGISYADMEIDTVQPLRFGHFVMMNNNAPHALTVTPAGVTNYPPAFVPVDQAQNGQYSLQGFNPDSDLSITINPPSLPLACPCGSPVFTVDNFDVEPDVVHTDPAGNATFRLGARLRSDGTQSFYRPGSYSGQLMLIINN